MKNGPMIGYRWVNLFLYRKNIFLFDGASKNYTFNLSLTFMSV